MGAALDDTALVEDNNFVSAANGREPVGDDQPSSTLEKLFERMLDFPLCITVDAGGCFVEH